MGWAVGFAVGMTAWAIWRDSLPRFRMWALLFLGVVTAGLLGSFDAHVAHWLGATGNSITGKILGISCGVIALAVFFTAEFWDSAKPGKNGKGGTRWFHSAMSFIFPEVLLAAGGLGAAALGFGTSLLTALPGTLNGLF